MGKIFGVRAFLKYLCIKIDRMATFGYIADTDTIAEKDLATTEKVMRDLGCESIHTESTKDTTERPWLKYIMEEVKEKDTIVFHKLSNALANVVELTNLCRLCYNKGVRLVSVLDSIDTKEEYCKFTPTDYLRMLATFNVEAYDSKHKQKEEELPSVRRIAIQRAKDDKEVRILNMYMAGYSYQEIMDEQNISSRKSIANLLKRHNIEPNRLNYDREIWKRKRSGKQRRQQAND